MNANTQAYLELAACVREVKKNSGALAAITVIVPTTAGCLDVTRSLAVHLSDLNGLVNIHAHTPSTLAEELFQSSLTAGGRVPVTALQREAAARAALQESPGAFGKLATRQATVQAVANTSALMDLIPDENLERIDPASLTYEIVRHHRRIRKALSGRAYFADEVIAAALSEVSNAEVRASLGYVITFQLSEPETALENLWHTELVSVVTNHSIAAPRDAATGVSLSAQLVSEAEIFNTTDADEEARAITRLVVEELNKGIAGHRIGIFMSSALPYRALLDRHLGAAGVNWAGSSTRQLIDTSVARNLLRFLACPFDEFDYRIVLDAMAERALVNSDPKFPTPAQAERDYRHLARDEEDGPENTLEARHARERRELFRDYVETLREEIAAALSSDTWLKTANALQSLVNAHFTPSRFRKLTFGNDDFDTPAVWRQELDLAVTALGDLDDIAPVPSAAAIVEQLEASIQQRYLRHGKQGQGVILSSLGSATARDLDVVIVCGLVEGLAPTRSFENPLFPDAMIELVGNPIPTSRQRALGQQSHFVSALASSSGRTILTYPRGNLRGGEQRVLSRWITAHFADEKQIKPTEVGSFLEGILTGAPAARAVAVTPQARAIASYRSEPSILKSLPLESELGNAVAMRRDRHHGNFTAFNGNLSGSAELITVMDKILSPTALEKYRRTPLSFFFNNVLKVVPLNDLVQSPTLDPLTRGTLVHEILEKWVGSAIESPPGATLENLLTIANEICDRYKEEVGTHWIEQYWQIDKYEISQDLLVWFEQHEELIASGWKPSAAEAKFGDSVGENALPAVEIELQDNNGTLRFIGQIDRIDLKPHGIHVIDYKGAFSKKYNGISSENITANGTMYQLPIYTKLAQQMLSNADEEATVQASYWFVRRDKVKVPLITVKMSALAADDLVAKLTALNHDVRAGAFPPIPDPGGYDTYTQLMSKDRLARQWDRIQHSEELTEITDFWSSLETKEAGDE